MREIAAIEIPHSLRAYGKCKHVRCGEDVTSQITSVELVQYEPGGGYYLLYKGLLGEELNDLFFDTTQECVEQIKFEFGEDISRNLAEQLV